MAGTRIPENLIVFFLPSFLSISLLFFFFRSLFSCSWMENGRIVSERKVGREREREREKKKEETDHWVNEQKSEKREERRRKRSKKKERRNH